MQLGSNFTAVCVLKEKCVDYLHVNAGYIFWKTNHATVPREQYTVINRTASSVTFPDFSLLNTQLTCNIRTFGQIDQNVYGISIVSGRKFPASRPGAAVTELRFQCRVCISRRCRDSLGQWLLDTFVFKNKLRNGTTISSLICRQT